jgi:quercetin dioxygenase-like cupin family protein
VLRGTLEYRLDGQAPVTLNAGQVLFIPAGAVHAVRNTGSAAASELATYIVEKGRPLITLVR